MIHVCNLYFAKSALQQFFVQFQFSGPSSARSIFNEFIMGKDKAQAPPSRHNFNNKRKNDEYFQPYSDSRNTALPPLPKHDFNNHRNSDPLFLPHPKSRNMDQFPPTRHNFSNQRNSDLYFAPTHVSRNVDQHPPRKHNFNNQRSSKPHHRRNSDPHFQPHLNSRDMDQLPPPRHNSSNQRNCRPQAQSQKNYPSKRPPRLDPLAQASNRASTFRENSVQNRLLKAQKEVLSRGNPGISSIFYSFLFFFKSYIFLLQAMIITYFPNYKNGITFGMNVQTSLETNHTIMNGFSSTFHTRHGRHNENLLNRIFLNEGLRATFIVVP